MSTSKFTIMEVSRLTGLDKQLIAMWIAREWVVPPEPAQLDDQDVARLFLIKDLIDDFGANEEAIPLILHLLDQLCHVQNEMMRLGSGGALSQGGIVE